MIFINENVGSMAPVSAGNWLSSFLYVPLIKGISIRQVG